VLTRQRVTAAVGYPNDAAAGCRSQRRMAMPMTPDPSAASWRRRDVVIESPAASATTAPRPPCRNPSSKHARTDGSSRASA
jgi:hypothetical protein